MDLAYSFKKRSQWKSSLLWIFIFIFPHFCPGRSENQPEGVQRERAGAYYQALRHRARQERWGEDLKKLSGSLKETAAWDCLICGHSSPVRWRIEIKAIFTFEGFGKIALPATVDLSHNKQVKAVFQIRILIVSEFSWACGSRIQSGQNGPLPRKKMEKISYLKLS